MTRHHTKYAGLFAVGLLIAGCSEESRYSAEEHIQRAKDFESSKEYRKAIIELKSAVQKAPVSAEARLLLGQNHIRTGDGAAAEKELIRARELGVSADTTSVLMGEALLLQKEYQRLLAEIQPEASSVSTRTRADILRLKGDAKWALNQLRDGCELYQAALEIDPKEILALAGLANCAWSRGDSAKTRLLLDQALKIEPDNPVVLTMLGDLTRDQGNRQAALEIYTQALKSLPGHVDALARRASLQMTLTDFASAQNDVQTLRKLHPNHPLTGYLQALLDFRQGKFHPAKERIDAVLRTNPEHTHSLLLAGAISYGLGNHELAVTQLQKVVSRMPGNTYARKLLAATFLQLNQTDKALEALKPLTASRDPQLLALIGQIHLKTKDYAKSVAYLEEAAAADPTNPLVRTELATALIAGGESAKAEAILETTAEQKAGLLQASAFLLADYLKKKEFDEVLRLVKQLEAKHPDNPVLFNFRGAAHLGKGDAEEARRNFEQAAKIAPTYFAPIFNLAELDRAQNNPNGARARYEGYLRKQPGHLESMMAMAKLSDSEGEAIDWLMRAASANGDASAPRIALAQRYLAQKNTAKALVYAKEAATLAPKAPQAFIALGAAQTAAGDTANAVASYRKLAELQPASTLPHYHIGSLLANTGDWNGARKAYAKSLELNPAFVNAKVALVLLEIGQGNYGAAQKIAQDSIRRYPKSPAGYALEGEVLMARKQYSQAAKSYETAYTLGKSPGLLIKLHGASRRAGGGTEAEDKIHAWLKDNPADQQVRMYLAEAYRASGKLAEAAEQYRTAIKHAPDNVVAHNNLATLYQELQDPRALPSAEEAFKLKPDSPDVMDTMGWALVSHGQVARGTALLRKAVAQAPNAPGIRFHLAQAYEAAGKHAEARQELEHILRMKGDNRHRVAAKRMLDKLKSN